MVFSRIIKCIGRLKIVAFELYKDAQLSEKLTQIDWGELQPGSHKDVKVWLQNGGSTPFIIMYDDHDWIPPEADNFITLSWDYNGSPIQQREVRAITLSLTVSEDIQGIYEYSFDITFSAEG